MRPMLPSLHGLRTLMIAGAAMLALSLPAPTRPTRAPRPRSAPPRGIAESDWSAIRAAHDAAGRAAVPNNAGYAFRSRGQRWSTQFDGRGFTTTPDRGGWSWGLQLTNYGPPASGRAVAGLASVAASGPRVEYSWDSTLTEWYQNEPRGFEHGYTVRSRPEGTDGSLVFTLATRGDLRPRVDAAGRNVRFVDWSEVPVVDYSGLAVVDAAGRSLPARFDANDTELQLSVDERGARYPITIDPVAQQAYLKASNAEAIDHFGCSAAVSGNTVVVGAYEEDSGSTGVNGDQSNNNVLISGAAYVFVRNGSAWSQQAYLKASNTGPGDEFGWCVAISGDTIVVSSLLEDSASPGVNGNQLSQAATDAGAAFVFVRNGTTWSQQAYLKSSNPGSLDYFGYSLAISGDTIVVGAWGEDSNATGVNGNGNDNSATESGAAYVFVRNGTSWSQQAYLKAHNTGSADRFGRAVAVAGDTVVVGAASEDSNATGVNGDGSNNSALDAGAAYVFVRSGVTWSQQAYLKASNTETDDNFGSSVAVSGDTVAVGALGEDSTATGVNGNQADNSATESGAVYVFARTGTTWTQQAYLKASNTGSGDQFGNSVAISGNGLVVGAYQEGSNATGINGDGNNNLANGSGAAYVFVRNGAAWSQQFYVKASNTGAIDHFGYMVGLSGDTLVAGAWGESSNATGVNGNQNNNLASQSGAAYVFDLDINAGVASYGTGTPGCAGTETLDANHSPIIGSPDFAITCNNCPPSTLGLGIIADAQDLGGSDPFGIGVLLHVDLFTAVEVVTVDFVSDGAGNGLAAVPIPNNPFLIGKTYYAMALWAWSSCSLPPFNLSTSRGLALTLLP